MKRLHAKARRCRTLVALALIPILLFSTSCAVLTRGSRQGIPFDSNPPGAEIYLDGELVGVTPTTVKLSRGRSHALLVRLGNQEREIVVKSSVDTEGWGYLFVDLVPGGLMSLSGALEDCSDPSAPFGCDVGRSLGIGLGLTTAGISVVVDLMSEAYRVLAPGEVVIDFDLIEESAPRVEGDRHEKDQW